MVDANPADANAQRKLALAYHNLGHLKEAAALYERLLATAEDAVLRTRLGNVFRDQGDYAGAEAAYRQAITDDPTLTAPYLTSRRSSGARAWMTRPWPSEEGLRRPPRAGSAREGRQAILARRVRLRGHSTTRPTLPTKPRQLSWPGEAKRGGPAEPGQALATATATERPLTFSDSR